MQKQSFSLLSQGESLAKQKGIHLEMLQLMTDVFAELEFVHYTEGQVTMISNPVQRHLSESAILQKCEQQLEVERQLCFASATSLKQWFHDMMNHTKQRERVVN